MTWFADAPASNAQAGPLGLLVVILLAIATFFLVRSMSKHLRKVPPTFDPAARPPEADGGPDRTDEGQVEAEPEQSDR